MDRLAAAAALGLGDPFTAWLEELERPAATSPPVALEPETVARVLRLSGCSEAATRDVMRTLPSARESPELWWLLERSHRRILATMGDPLAEVGRWPLHLPEQLGIAGRCFPFHLCAAVAPTLIRWHRSRGIPAAVVAATLADLGRHEAIERRVSATTGVDAPWWLSGHLRGLLLEVDGLQYEYCSIGPGNPVPWYDEREAAALGPGFRRGDRALSLHIPRGAGIDPEVIASSALRARELHSRGRTAPPPRLLTCSSWLMDDALAGYLPADSAIVRFQRSFKAVPGGNNADAAVLQFVFRHHGAEVTRAAARSRLQHAVLDHLEAGRHFRWCTGWRELDRAGPAVCPRHAH